ncbi:hypothetical protein LCGC14_1712270 [marine sediment metagenome]|uniref:Uncharacterized protein n=1 Tax=marine sediment metagenome TaxID=412755 RepID=A0A0F9JVB3_9ZZZZ
MVLGAVHRERLRGEGTCLTCTGPVLFGEDVRVCHGIGLWHEDCGTPAKLSTLIWKARMEHARTNAFQSGLQATTYAVPYDRPNIVANAAA